MQLSSNQEVNIFCLLLFCILFPLVLAHIVAILLHLTVVIYHL